MPVILDIIFAFVIGSILFLIIFTLMGNINQAHFDKTLTTTVQTNLVTIAQMIESDFLKIGYHAKDDAIQYADSSTIRFKTDLKNDGIIVNVKYSLGGPIIETRNPRDFRLIREASGYSAINASVGLTSLKFTYFNSNGNIMPSPITSKNLLDSIKAIRVKIKLESLEPVYSYITGDSTYQSVFWEKTFYPRNIPREN